MAEKSKKKIKDTFLKIKDLVLSPYPNPKRDWFFLISSFFLVLFLMAIVNLSVFFYYEYLHERSEEMIEGSSYSGEVVGDGLELNREGIDGVWDFFREKEKKSDLVRGSWDIKEPLQESIDLEGLKETDSEDGEEGDLAVEDVLDF